MESLFMNEVAETPDNSEVNINPAEALDLFD